MSLTDRPNPTSRAKPETILIAVFTVLVLGIIIYFSSQSQQRLRTSPIGLDGLQVWLSAQDRDARVFTGGWSIEADSVGLLVLPIHDSDLHTRREPPKTKEELLLQQDEYDAGLGYHSKPRLAETLIVLPKWRTGLRLTGLGHPLLLVEESRVTGVLSDALNADIGGVSRIPRPFSNFSYTTSDDAALEATLYVAQVFEGKGCTPIIGTPGAMVLAECTQKRNSDPDVELLVLSDPDLLNNHGLRLGDNARIASEFISDRAGDKTILIDYSTSNWLSETENIEDRERTWSDLMRFFDYPFTILWFGAGVVMGVVLWRSGLRYGPIIADSSRLTASKLGAISARAKLMRLTGQDGAMLSDYAAARIAAASAAIFGAMRPASLTEEEAFLRHLKRHAPEYEQRLTHLLGEIRALPAQTPARLAITYVEDLETLLEQTANVT